MPRLKPNSQEKKIQKKSQSVENKSKVTLTPIPVSRTLSNIKGIQRSEYSEFAAGDTHASTGNMQQLDSVITSLFSQVEDVAGKFKDQAISKEKEMKTKCIDGRKDIEHLRSNLKNLAATLCMAVEDKLNELDEIESQITQMMKESEYDVENLTLAFDENKAHQLNTASKQINLLAASYAAACKVQNSSLVGMIMSSFGERRSNIQDAKVNA